MASQEVAVTLIATGFDHDRGQGRLRPLFPRTNPGAPELPQRYTGRPGTTPLPPQQPYRPTGSGDPGPGGFGAPRDRSPLDDPRRNPAPQPPPPQRSGQPENPQGSDDDDFDVPPFVHILRGR
jgi:hypothetical protein